MSHLVKLIMEPRRLALKVFTKMHEDFLRKMLLNLGEIRYLMKSNKTTMEIALAFTPVDSYQKSFQTFHTGKFEKLLTHSGTT